MTMRLPRTDCRKIDYVKLNCCSASASTSTCVARTQTRIHRSLSIEYRMKFGKEIDTHVGRADMAKWNNKAELCHRLAAGRPIMLVEDDKDEIARARKAGLDTCFVAKRTGMHQEEVDILLGWANK